MIAALAGLLSFCVFQNPLILSQYCLLLLIGMFCLSSRSQPRLFLALGAAASILLIVFSGVANQRRMAALKQRYPMQSLTERLAYESHPAAVAIQQESNQLGVQEHPLIEQCETILPKRSEQLDALDVKFAGRANAPRIRDLRQVHDSQVSQFISSEGFGVGRGVRPLTRLENDRKISPVPMPEPAQPGPQVASAADESPSQPPIAPPQLRLTELHSHALLDFADPDNFGYVQDRDHVAGFEPHGFTEMPMLDGLPRWRVQRVELVSLLKHERPMVYQSEFLPKMDELKSAPVRELDAFEQRGLKQLRLGEELDVEWRDRQILMLGAIRAATQCLQCHSVERGALLGAFSYELLPEGQPAKAMPIVKSTL